VSINILGDRVVWAATFAMVAVADTGFPVTLSMENVVYCVSNACP
jgi:hypothetical protein